MISINVELKGVVRAGVLRLSNIQFKEGVSDALWQKIDAACNRIGEQFKGITSGHIPGAAEARKLYRAVGIDPTKVRPSSEALLRRVIKEKGLYRVHPLVDLFNLVSLETLLPVGLYDDSKIKGSVTIQLGKEGWGFDGIRKDRVNVEGRLCVADDLGPFGSPTSDSLRTCIEGHVHQALAIFFQHIEGDRGLMDMALGMSAELAGEYFSSSVVANVIDA